MKNRLLLLCLYFFCVVPIGASTFTVTNNLDRGEGSFRWAVEQSNRESGISNIRFDLPSGSKIVIDTTITFTTPFELDGSLDDGVVTIVSEKRIANSNESYMFNVESEETDSIVFRNIKIGYDIKDSYALPHIINADSVSGKILFDNVNLFSSWFAIKVLHPELVLEIVNCSFDSIQSNVVSGVPNDPLEQMSNYVSWKRVVVDNCLFRKCNNTIEGCAQNHRSLLKISNCSFESCDYLVAGVAPDTVVVEKCNTNNCRIGVGIIADDVVTKVIVDSCNFTNCVKSAIECALDGMDIQVTHCTFSCGQQSTKEAQLVYLSREYYSDKRSKVLFEHNVVGDASYYSTGMLVDATNVVVRNNYFYGNGIGGFHSEGYAFADWGSDTLLLENNVFGMNRAGEVLPNVNNIRFASQFYEGIGLYGTGKAQFTIKDNTIIGAKENSVHIDSLEVNAHFTNNLFLNTNGLAIDNIREDLPTPKITSVTNSGSHIVVRGTCGEGGVIELYKNDGKPQNSIEYLATDNDTPNGEFELEISHSKFPGEKEACFIVSATYETDGIRATSNFSEQVCSSLCPTDTTLATDTLIAGEPFIDGEVYTVGRHDSIFETITLPNGCDSVVMHLLIVKPDPTKLNYYVKTERWGAGDGSSWENAMNGKDFAVYLPLAPDGATFYVAEGEYMPDSEYSKQSDGVYFTTDAINVSIVGGFSTDIKRDTLSDPQKYETILRSAEKAERCFVSNSTNFYGVVFESPLLVRFPGNKTVTFDKCTFREIDAARYYTPSTGSNIVGHYQTPESIIEFRECQFLNNKSTLLQGYQTPYNVGVDKYYGCSFVGNEADILFYFPGLSGSSDLYEFVNCTFTKNKAKQYFSFQGGLRLYNNSFFNNEADVFLYDQSYDNSESSTIVGNVFLKNDFTAILDGGHRTTSSSYFDLVKHNLFQSEMAVFSTWPDNINLSGAENQGNNLFDLDASGEFVLKNNGGFTPTVALKSDTLPDGTSIRFPLSETTVTTDQRGVARLEQTCMGAYELVCSPVEVKIADTIVAGDDYSFNDVDLSSAISKVGVHKFSDTLRCVSGCDSIIQLSLTVRPQKREGGYYVKKKGTGDGSDWENAMSPEDFSNHLPLAYDGDTFHIAEGVYKSSFVDSTMGRVYRVNSSVSLIGGYPDTVSSVSTPPTPELFVTKLSADVKNNDYTYYYPHSLDYTPYSNFEENDSLLLYVTGEKKLTLFGLTLSGVKSCDRGVIDLSDGASLEMNQTVVQGNAASAIRGENVDVFVNNSLFTHNYSKRGAVFRLKGSKLNVYSSSAYENMALVNDCDAQYAVGGIFYLENSEVLVENSTLASNSADMGGVFGFKSSKLNLINNTVVGNQLLPTSSHQGSVLASLDAQDETELSSVVLFGNLIAGNQHPEIGGYANFESGDYNIFSFNAASISQGEHDMFMTDPKEIQQLLDGEMLYNSESVFIPIIQYNGGYTPTIAVIQSLFNGGDILSIPRAERKVDYDQRGFVRKDTSCVGAFEFPTFMGYYVKKNSQGDGSGRNWENCMGDTTFARYFPIVPTNASFYIAEGTYSPMFDSYGKLTKSKSRSYSSARLLNLYGGYPADAQDGSVANPAKYKTTLSVDYNGDDIYTLSQEGYSSITSLNTSDNGYYIVSIYSKTPGYAEIKGIEFRGQRCVPKASSSALNLHAHNTTGLNFRLEQCSFIGNYTGVSSSCDSMIVTECFFDTISAYAFSHSSFQSEKSSFLLVDKSTFANSLYSLYTYSVHGLMRVQNSTFANSVYNIFPPGDLRVSADNTKLEIYNNSFFSNSKENVGLFIYDFIPVELKGNIFSFSNIMVQSDPNYRNESLPIVSDFNVYTAKSDAISLGVHDTIVSPLSIAEIVKGEVKDDRFEVELTQQESYAMTPTLVNVNFAEGGGIKRMPENATPVTEDQRGVERPTVDYCVGAIEADCDFSGSVMKLNAEKTEVCRGDSVELKLSGLTLLEENTFKFRWSSNDAKALFSDSAVHDTKLYLKGQEELVEAKLTITNVCGQDTVLTVAMKVNGTGEVPFTGIDEQGPVCLNVAEPIELSSEVEGAMFRGECIVNGHFFDPTLAETDSTIVRCYIESGDTGCEIYTEQVVYIQRKDESIKSSIQLLKSADQTCGITPNGMLQFVISDIPENLTFRVEGPAYPECVKETIEHTGKREISVTIDSILAGDYRISVTDGCYDYGSVTATIEDLYSLQITREPQITDVHCYGEKNGAALFKVKRNTDDFNMILENKDEVEETPLLEFNESVLQISGLAGGEYRLIFQSTSEFCMDETAIQFSVSAPTKPFEISQLNVTGEGCEATIEPIVIAGGTEGIEYKWTNFVSSQEVLTETPEPTLFNSGAGKYMCVAYSKECNLIDTAYVEVPSSSVVVENLIITPNAIDEACMGMNNGRIKCTIDSVNKKRVEVTIVTENLSNGVKTLSTYNRADNIIRVNDLAPGDYRITAYQGSPECVDAPSDFDTVLTIRPMLNSLQFISLDEIADAHCLSNKDAYAKLTAIGVAAGQKMEILSDNVVVNSYKYFDRVADTAYYNAKNLVSGDFVARIINSCSDTALYNFSIGGTQPFELSIDSATSIFTYDCPTDDGPKGTVKAVCEGGADSMRISLFKYDRKNPTIAKEIATDKINQGMMPYSATYQDLLSGKYVVRLESLIPNCSDLTEVEFEIVGNDIIHLDSLIVEGRGCDAIIIPYASGDETGYTFHWNNAISHLEKSSSDTLFHAGAGTFSCVALSNHCKAYSDTLFVNVPSGSTPINVNITLTHRDESCFEANNGYIRCAVDSVNGERVPVTIVTEKLGEDKFRQVTYDDPHYKDNVIRVWDVEPGEYRVTAYQGSLECVEAPSDFDTIITIKPMSNQLQFHSLDSIKEAVCLAERDAHAYLTAIGVAPGQHIEVLHADTLYAEFSYKWRKEDTAHYDISNLIFGDFTARIINSCKDTVLYDFMVGGTKPYIVSVDSSKSELKVKCPSDTTGIISALFSGGADSCFCYLQRLNSDGRYKIIQSGVVFSHEAVQEVKYTGLGKGNYMLVMTSTIPGCNDIGIFNIEITGPADVVGRHQILDISCNAFTDGSVTFKPHRRGTSAPVNYVIHRDSALIEEHYDAYMLYKKEETKVPDRWGDMVDGYSFTPVMYENDKQIVVKINKVFDSNEFYYRDGNSLKKIESMETLEKFAPGLYQNDFVSSSFKWYQKSEDNWLELTNIVLPDSSDFDEAWYFSGKDTIKTPVWGCSHLDQFWEEEFGAYLESDAITLANLAPAWYKVIFEDTLGCPFVDSFEVKRPVRPLKFDSVSFDAELAECDPAHRYITAYVDGGWGGYNYSFAPENVGDKQGGAYDGYLGGNYVQYDSKKLKGSCRSEFLLPGNYLVMVVDEKGCFEKFNAGTRIAVKSKFSATVDTVNVLCPEEDDAPVVLNLKDDEYNGLYDIYEYASDCLNNTCDTCNRDTFSLVRLDAKKDTVQMQFGNGTHGLFIYRTSNDKCGTYVPAVVTDTIPAMRLQMEAMRNVSCAEAPIDKTSDGMIKLSILGGVEPYTLYRDKSLFSDEHISSYSEFKDSSIYKNDQLIKTIKTITLNDLAVGRYYFTVVDQNNCIRHMGADKSVNDTVIVLDSPKPISSLVTASSICPKEGLADGIVFADQSSSGGVFTKYVDGGVAPYSYRVEGFSEDLSDPYIPVTGDETSQFHYVITDNNGCLYDTTVMFGNDEIKVERIDFLVSKYNKNGDVIALVDMCGPEAYFDSVSYEISGEHAEKFEILDRRMLIYDIEGGSDKAKKILYSQPDTKSIPDGFFAENFQLIDKFSSINKHINFIKLNETASSAGTEEIWRECHLKMYAYFNGCRYTVEKNGIVESDIFISQDDFNMYEGGVQNNNDILDISLSPNPYSLSGMGELKINITFGAEVDYNIYIYSMDGNISTEIVGKASDLKASSVAGEFVVEKRVNAADIINVQSQVFVVLVRTRDDADAKLLLIEN